MDYAGVVVVVKIEVSQIDFLNKIMEGHEGYALVSTIDPFQGILHLNTSKTMLDDLLKILEDLPITIETLSIIA